MLDDMATVKMENIEAEINAILEEDDLATSVSVLDLALDSLNSKIVSTKLHQLLIEAALAEHPQKTRDEATEIADKGIMSVLGVIVLSALSTVYREDYNSSKTVHDFCECLSQSHVTVANALAAAMADQSNLSKMVLHTVAANAERITNIIELDKSSN